LVDSRGGLSFCRGSRPCGLARRQCRSRYPHRTTAARGVPTADAQQDGQAKANRAAAEAAATEGHRQRRAGESDKTNGQTAGQGEGTSHRGTDAPENRKATANIKSTTVYQNEKGREARTGRDTRHGWPSLAGALAGKAPARGRLAALRGACLGLAGRGNGRHSRPQAAFPRAPPRANARGGGACAANARGGLNCGPRTARAEQAALAPRSELAARRGASARGAARRGPQAGQREPRGAATPGGECAGRAERHGLRRRRGRAGEAGRSAADRAGGADGPTAPTSWGPGRAGAPTPQPARGRSKARPAAGGLPWPCFAEGCPRATAGGQLGRDAPQARPWPPHYPSRPARP
jgi:hypothetical protein